jgi:hypothetical protein
MKRSRNKAPVKPKAHAVAVRDHENVKRTEHTTPQSLIDRWAPTEPITDGFHAEWLRLRAGGSEA